MSILVLAGDLTNYYLYKSLKESNYSVNLEGFNHLLHKQNKKEIVVKGYKTVIVPIPLTIDGSTLYSPYSEESIHIDHLFQKVDKNARIIGGPFNFQENRVYDITRNKEFTDQTVIPTCEEIIKIIISRSNITIFNSTVVITGEGRIKNRLSVLLNGLGATLLDLSRVVHCDVIINSTRDFILDQRILENCNREVLIIDITSDDSNIDYKYAKEVGIEVIKARGLPGKSAPKSVSNYILRTLIAEEII